MQILTITYKYKILRRMAIGLPNRNPNPNPISMRS